MLLVILFGFPKNIFSQQVYRIIKGDIFITMKHNDSALIAVSNQLIETIDYETSKITFSVDYETLRTGIDSIDNKLKLLKNGHLKFSGKIDLRINTLNNSLQKFNIEGMFDSTSPPSPVFGNGSLICYNSGNNVIPSCMLTLTMNSTLKINLANVFINTNDEIQIDIRQSLLEKEKMN